MKYGILTIILMLGLSVEIPLENLTDFIGAGICIATLILFMVNPN